MAWGLRHTRRVQDMRTAQELIERQERARAAGASGSAVAVARPQTSVAPGEWHFICECFWLTSTTLHLGLFKVR